MRFYANLTRLNTRPVQVIPISTLENPKWGGQSLRFFLRWREEENRKKKAQDSCFPVNPLVSVLLLIAASQKAAHWQFYTQLDKSGVWSGGSWKVQTGWRGEKKGRRWVDKKRERRKSRVWGWTSQTKLSILFAFREALQAAAETPWASGSTAVCKSLQRPLGTREVIWLLGRQRHHNKYCATVLKFLIEHTM